MVVVVVVVVVVFAVDVDELLMMDSMENLSGFLMGGEGGGDGEPEAATDEGLADDMDPDGLSLSESSKSKWWSLVSNSTSTSASTSTSTSSLALLGASSFGSLSLVFLLAIFTLYVCLIYLFEVLICF